MNNIPLRMAIAFVCIFYASAVAVGQSFMAPVPPNLPVVNQYGATMRQILDSMYTTGNPFDSSEGGELSAIKEFRLTWEGRVYSNDSSGTNMFQRYYQAMKTEAAAKITAGTCDDGKWQCIGAEVPGLQLSGYITTIWANPADSNVILAGTIGGLFKTTNAGATWNCITDNANIAGPSLRITSIAVNPTNSNIIFIGTAGGGILKSFDGGGTWASENILSDGEVISKVFFTPDAVRIYAYKGMNIYTRLSTASSWTDITPGGVVNAQWKNMQFVPGNRSHIFVSSEGGNTGIWETTDSLATSGWNKITEGFSYTIGGTYTSPTGWRSMDISIPGNDTLYFIGMDSMSCLPCPKAAMFKYNISGSTHSITLIYDDLPYDRNPTTAKFQLIVSPSNPNNIYYATDIPYQAYNRSIPPIAIGKYDADPTHGDVRCIYLQQHTSDLHGKNDRLYLATDGGASEKPSGVDVVSNGYNSTKDISGHGLNCGTYWGYSTYEADAGIGAMMHDGIVSFQPDVVPQWHSIDVVDGWNCNVDKSDPDHAYVTEGMGDVAFRHTDAGSGRKMNSYTDVTQPTDGSFDGLGVGAPFVTDKVGNVYFLKNSFWKKKPSDAIFFNRAIPYGTPTSDDYFGAAIAFDPNDTSFDGYLLYNTVDWHVQHIFYRKPSYIGAIEISALNPIPGASSYHITGIATDPNNTERVWVSLGEVNYNTYSHTRYRIFYSANHGATWVDVSNGLPQKVPVGSIVFDEAANVIYASTDLGVYRCNFNGYNPASNYTNSDGVSENDGILWKCFNKGAVEGKDFPNISGSMHINHCQGKLYVATFGRSVWSSDLYDGDASSSPEVVTSTTTWSQDRLMLRSIRVVTGATLTLSNMTLQMPENGIITVEAGAGLVVVGSTITNNCSQCMWQGIQGLGTYAVAQNATNQSTITITNSTIKHAKQAITNLDPFYSSGVYGSGAIVHATNSVFQDNLVSVDLNEYHNISGWSSAPNLSYFDRCKFIVDKDFKLKGSWPMVHHVFMKSVEGIRFTGCQFLNRDWNMNYINGTWGFGIGIDAVNAGFSVVPYCAAVGCPTPQRSYFSGLGHGVLVRATTPLSQIVRVDQADFDSTVIGVHVSVQQNVAVSRCKFIIGRGANFDTVMVGNKECGNIGLLVQNATQFAEQENTYIGRKNYYPYSWTQWNNIGVLIANTGGYANRIYRSTFDSLTMAVYSVGNNRFNVTTGSAITAGLKISCNTFSKNAADIVAVNSGTALGQGISTWQGNATTPAGNTFSGSASNIMDLSSSGGMEYYYGTGTGQAPSLYSTGVYVHPISLAPSCPSLVSTLPGGKVAHTQGDGNVLTQYESDYYSASTAVTGLLSTFNGLLDNGDTKGLIHDMNTKWYSTMAGRLTGYSPYLSTDVLLRSAQLWGGDKDARDSLTDLYVQNPDAALDENFFDSLLVYGFNSSDVDYIRTAANNNMPTSRTNTVSSIDSAQTVADDALNEIIMYMKSPFDSTLSDSDTTGGACQDTTSIYYTLDSNATYQYLDSIPYYLATVNQQWARYQMAGYLEYTHQLSAADALVKDIENAAVTDQETEEYRDYNSVWQLLRKAEDNGRNALMLTDDELASLDETGVPDMPFNIGKQIEWNLWTMKYIIYGSSVTASAPVCRVVVLQAWKHSNSSADHTGNNPAQPVATITKYGKFAAYPNPASGMLTFWFDLRNAQGGLDIQVTDILGRVVMSRHTDDSKGEEVWDVTGVAPGVYTYKATCAAGVVSIGKLVIAR